MNNNRKNRRYRYSKSSYNAQNKIPKTSLSSFVDKSATTSEDVPELPGFYYDHAKNKYFKIGSNNFGVSSVVTTQSIAKIQENKDFSDLSRKFKRPNSVLNTLAFIEIKGYNSNAKMDLKDYLIKTSVKQKLYSNYPYDTFITNKIRDIQVVEINDDQVLLLENSSIDMNRYYSSVKKLRLSDLDHLTCEKKIYGEMMGIRNMLTDSRNLSQSSHTKMYFHNQELFVKSDKQSLEIQHWKTSEIDNTILADLTKTVSVPFEILCSALSYKKTNLGFPYRILVGSEQRAALITAIENCSCSNTSTLFTKSSAAYCVSFGNSDDNLAFIGCRNRYIYGYDLRIPVDRDHKFTVEYEHQSCVNSLVMGVNDSNTLISSDYSGNIYVWDLRQNKTVGKYHDLKNKCSVKLSKCGKYLYSVSKEGNVNIWNLKTTELLRTIKSPIISNGSGITYAEEPAIDVSIESKLFYSINNQMFVYCF